MLYLSDGGIIKLFCIAMLCGCTTRLDVFLKVDTCILLKCVESPPGPLMLSFADLEHPDATGSQVEDEELMVKVLDTSLPLEVRGLASEHMLLYIELTVLVLLPLRLMRMEV